MGACEGGVRTNGVRVPPGQAREAEAAAEVGRPRGQLQRAWVLGVGGSPHLILGAVEGPGGAEQGSGRLRLCGGGREGVASIL